MAAQAALLLACFCALLSAGLSLRMDAGAVPTPKRMAGEAGNQRPIIGILSQEITPLVKENYDPEGRYRSYIAASYVKFIEASGARVVPVLSGQPRDYYTRMAKSVNGVLFPGGATFLDPPNGYGASGQAMLEEVKNINNAGGHMPVLGICLGMQLIAIEESGGIAKDIRDTCSSLEQQLPLEFTPAAKDSNLFKDAPQRVLEILSTQNVTINHHRFCVTENKFKERKLDSNWKILSKNRDENGLEFISSFEAKGMPIYGVQFHPEKNSFEWKINKVYNHSESAILAARHFADVLVSEARKNDHSFDENEETRNLIYNYQPTYTGDKLMFEQLYFFEHEVVNTRPEPTAADYSPVASYKTKLILSDRESKSFN